MPTFCEICAESRANGQMFKVQNCNHVFCNVCVAKHIQTKLQDNTLRIVCLALNCRESIEFRACNSILPKNVIEKWKDQLLHESSIQQFQRTDSNERSIEDLLLKKLAGEKGWKRCPRCGYFVEKTSGCNHVTCRCKFEFCYTCGGTCGHNGCSATRI